MTNDIKRAEIVITVTGTAGSGKTGTAVAIAKMLLCKGARVVIEDQDGYSVVSSAMNDDRIDTYAQHLDVTIKTVSTFRPTKRFGE